MRYIFTALRAEAAALIKDLNLKQTDFPIPCYENENTVLAVTGTGPLSASAACGAVLAARPHSNHDIVINAGIAASCRGGVRDRMYAVHKIHDLSSGRDYYPDLIPAASLPEASLITGAKPYVLDMFGLPDRNEPVILYDPVVLYDMEGSAIMHAASLFLAPHRIRILKLVSDFGDETQLRFDSRWAQMISDAVQQEAAAMESLQGRPEKILPDIEALAEDLHASVAMRRRLEQAVRYAQLAGIDMHALEAAYRRDGLLPAADRQAGKLVLERLIYDLQD